MEPHAYDAERRFDHIALGGIFAPPRGMQVYREPSFYVYATCC